jgi:hypothetical protein
MSTFEKDMVTPRMPTADHGQERQHTRANILQLPATTSLWFQVRPLRFMRTSGDMRLLAATYYGLDRVRLLLPDGSVECDTTEALLRACVDREWLVPITRQQADPGKPA